MKEKSKIKQNPEWLLYEMNRKTDKIIKHGENISEGTVIFEVPIVCYIQNRIINSLICVNVFVPTQGSSCPSA